MADGIGENFWAGTNLQGVKDPKRNFRFRISFVGTDLTSSPFMNGGGVWFAKTCTQPSLTFTESSVDFMMHKFYWPAKATWNEVDITLVDPVEPHATGKLLKIISDSGYKIPTNGSTGFTSINKGTANVALGNILIEQLDHDGKPNHSWTLVHSWAKEISFSNLDYSNEELMEISLKIRYDWAEFASGEGITTDGIATPLFKP
jgi:hypothetical protein